jgi:response regulator NasT
MLRVMLENHLGHRVVCEADNGKALIDACTGMDVDLAILDFEMPVLDGLATAELLTKNKNIPVILLSGHPDLQHIVVDNEPVALCLTKPVSLETLERSIAALFK